MTRRIAPVAGPGQVTVNHDASWFMDGVRDGSRGGNAPKLRSEKMMDTYDLRVVSDPIVLRI